MRLRGRKIHEEAVVVDQASVSLADAELHCSRCGTTLESTDAYCPDCGASVAASTEESSDPVRQGRRAYRGRILVAALLSVLALALVGGLTFAWLHERSDRINTQDSLATERARSADLTAELMTVTANLTETEAQLKAAEQLSEARARVLAQTENVLKRVDPLLSSVDELQGIGAQIQDGRDNFRGAADAFINEVIDFANYLLQVADPFATDNSYINAEIDYLNGQLSDVNSAASGLDDHDAAYARSSQQFGNRADAYSSAVQRLQRALAEVNKS